MINPERIEGEKKTSRRPRFAFHSFWNAVSDIHACMLNNLCSRCVILLQFSVEGISIRGILSLTQVALLLCCNPAQATGGQLGFFIFLFIQMYCHQMYARKVLGFVKNQRAIKLPFWQSCEFFLYATVYHIQEVEEFTKCTAQAHQSIRIDQEESRKIVFGKCRGKPQGYEHNNGTRKEMVRIPMG